MREVCLFKNIFVFHVHGACEYQPCNSFTSFFNVSTSFCNNLSSSRIFWFCCVIFNKAVWISLNETFSFDVVAVADVKVEVGAVVY